MPKDKGEARSKVARLEGPSGSNSFDVVFPVCYAVFFALTAFIIHLKFFPIGGVGVESDFYTGLVPAARELWKGNISVASYPYKGPFYSFALVFIHMFGGDWYRNGVVLNLLCASGSLLVLYRLFLRTFNRRLAVVATISVSLVAEFFVHAHKASSDTLFFLLCFLVISLLLIEKWSWVLFAGAGVFSAFAFLTRYNGAFLPVVAVVVILFIDPWRWPRRRRIMAASIYMIAFALVCAPWFVLNLAETGNWLETDNIRNVVEEFSRGVKASDTPDGGFTSVASLISHDPVHFVTRYLLNIPRHLWLDVRHALGLEVGILVLLGLLRLLFVPPTRKQWAFFSFGIGYFLSMCMVFYLPRFSFPILPMYLAAGFSLLVGPHGDRRSRLWEIFGRRLFGGLKRLAVDHRRAIRVATPLVIAGLFLMQIQWVVRAETFYFSSRPLFILPAARFLKDHAGSEGKAAEKIVLARKPHIAYYAGMKYRMYPLHLSDSRDLIVSAIELGADYVVYSKLEYMYYPEDTRLANLESELGVKLIYSEKEINVYEVADWLDLKSPEGAAGLREMLARLRAFRRADHQEAVMRACAELSLLYSCNQNIEKAGEYLLFSLKAAGKLPASEEMDRRVRLLWNELMLIASEYSDQGRQDDGAALVSNALRLIDFGPGRYEEGATPMEDVPPGSERYRTIEKLASAHKTLSGHFLRQGRMEGALEHLHSARELYARLEDRRQAALMESLIGELETDE